MTQMAAELTLTGFLLARIAEDEQVARAADSRPWWIPDRENGYSDVHDEMTGKFVALEVHDRHAEHIARHAPARVLAECEAKRRILAHHWRGGVHRYEGDEDGPQCQACDAGYCSGACPTMKALALPYADHPHYREEWRP